MSADQPRLGVRSLFVPKWHARMAKWLTARSDDALLRACGTITSCVWCGEWMNAYAATSMRPYEDEPSLDEWTCGNCGGRSVTLWGMGNHLMKALDHPAQLLPDRIHQGNPND